MKTLVNAYHPQLANSRVNRRWLEALEGQADITVNRLYERYPDWCIDVTREQALFC